MPGHRSPGLGRVRGPAFSASAVVAAFGGCAVAAPLRDAERLHIP
ncbi:hypothetical protein [Streptomyces flavovirens]